MDSRFDNDPAGLGENDDFCDLSPAGKELTARYAVTTLMCSNFSRATERFAAVAFHYLAS